MLLTRGGWGQFWKANNKAEGRVKACNEHKAHSVEVKGYEGRGSGCKCRALAETGVGSQPSQKTLEAAPAPHHLGT